MKKAVLISLAILVLGLMFPLLLYMYGNPHAPKQRLDFPDTGIWVCNELGITLYQDEGFATVKVDGLVIRCDCWHERGDDEIYIDCDEDSNPQYEYRHRFFSGVFLESEADVFYIQETGSEIIYVFRKVSDSLRSSE